MIKKHKTLLAYMLALAVFTTYVVMDTFVITRVYGEAADGGASTEGEAAASETPAQEAATESTAPSAPETPQNNNG
jgi:hypothetical protein